MGSAAVLTSSSTYGPVLTYTGVGSMFNITDAHFTIRNIQLDHPNAQAYNVTDSVGGQFSFSANRVRHLSGTKYGTFSDPQIIIIEVCSAFNIDSGISISGTNILINSIDKMLLISTNATFKAIDLGSSISQTTEFRDVTCTAPAGAFGISGLASSGNIPANRIAMVNNCEFSGGMTDLENITNSDKRFDFKGNTPTADTIIDAMLSLNNNATATVISIVNTPVLVAGTWVTERDSLFTGTAAGRITYIGERDIVLPIDITATAIAASGTNKDIHTYLALNGTVIANSGKQNRIGATDPKNTGVLWQLNMSPNDYLEVFVENNTDTVNIVVQDAILRAR